MRILLVIDSLGTGGAERSTADFWYFLRQRGDILKIIALSHRSEGVESELVGSKFDIQFIKASGLWNQVREIMGVIHEFSPDLVHSILFKSNVRVRIARHFTKFLHLESLVNEMYSSIRVSDPNVSRIKLEAYRLYDRALQYKGVDHFHANGSSVARHYQEKLGIKPQRISIIHRGRKSNSYVQTEGARQEMRNELKTGNRLLVINVARHEFQKGQDVLLDALANMHLLKDHIQVVLVGREGNLTHLIKEKIRTHNLGDLVTILGHRNDVPRLLAASDIFVFPSRFEGFPGALIEAEAAGLPIVCSDIANNREIAEENLNALFFGVDDAHGMAAKISEVIKDAERRDRMGKESLNIYETKFSQEKIHQKMLTLFDNLIQGK